MFYQKLDAESILCLMCAHQCRVLKNQRGFCRVKENLDGKYYNIVYERPCAIHIDPIEKKPFFHVLPASTSFSIATVGCNLRCKFCQNWQISQAEPEHVKTVKMSCEDIILKAKQNNCASIAYTYTEPLMFYEYVLDIAQLAKKENIKNVMHSNGYLKPEPLENLIQNFSAINIDLKGFSERYYQDICGGSLEPVLESLILIKKRKDVWLEITNLIIPTLNDDPAGIKKMCLWICDNLGADVPLHFSRFFPTYKLTTLPPTPLTTLENARKIAHDAGVKFVYIGNAPGHEAENTYCPKCAKALIKRSGYVVLENNVINGKCPECAENISGVWS
ncbi:MAG: AmmeMemoRadiSam system radical SAM enzyme [Candidatus Omnitrophica bacterium]|nr:AmmeMemoRadiSam system radical SAM enzyme [Candidatus Omnitrophota bacterium]